MIAPNDQPRYQKSSIKPIQAASMCVNMVYDAGPITQAERTAAGKLIDAVGSVERAREVLRHIPESSK